MLSVLQAISSRVLLQLLLLYHKQRQLQQQQQQKEGNNKCLLTFYSHCVGSKRRRHTDTLVISFPRMQRLWQLVKRALFANAEFAVPLSRRLSLHFELPFN